jgi:lysophospholipase L1-like esterase
MLLLPKLTTAIPKSLQTAAWTLVVLLVAEAALRARAWHRHGGGSPVADLYQLDSHGRRELKAGATMAGAARTVRINNLGFRGPDIETPKPPGVVRIAALGDSTTFGMEAGDDESIWLARLVAELGESSGVRLDSVNGAVPGQRLEDSIRLHHERIDPLEPDIVIIKQAATDIAAHARRQYGASAGHAHSATAAGAMLEEHSLLINLVRVNAASLTSCWLPGKRNDSLDSAGVAAYKGRLRELVDRCRARNRQVVLCTTPRSFGDRPDQYSLAASALANNPGLSLKGLNAAFDAYNDAVREVAARTEAPLVDLDRIIPRGSDYFVDAVHLNDAGHRLVGRTIADELQKRIDPPSIARSGP